MMEPKARRTIIVTGGSKGIGRAVCLAFASPDWQIFFNYASDADAAAKTEKLVSDAGGCAKGILANVASETDVESFFKQILEAAGRIDVLVNNAGIARDGLLVRMKEKDWNDVIDINLKGVFMCSKIAAKTMLKQHSGRIISISSVIGAMGNPGQANYAASKAGIIGFTKSIAKELASRNITANVIAPGYIETDMTSSMTEKAAQVMISQIPLGRAGKPEEVAALVSFLASDQASYITGQVIHINGGLYV